MQKAVLDDIRLAIRSIKEQVAELEDKLNLLEELEAKAVAEAPAPKHLGGVASVMSKFFSGKSAGNEPEQKLEEKPKTEPKKEPVLIVDPSIEYGYATPDPRYLSGDVKPVDDFVEPFEPEPAPAPAAEPHSVSSAFARGDASSTEHSSPASEPAPVADTRPASSAVTRGEASSAGTSSAPVAPSPAPAAEQHSASSAFTRGDASSAEHRSPATASAPAPAVIDVMTSKLAWKADMPGSPVKNVLSAISLNDRVLFINTLFNEDPILFTRAITAFNSYTTLAEAESYIADNFPDWNLESDVVYRFMMAVRRKLNK